MEKFIPYEKLSKKEQQRINKARRSTWGDRNPVTRKPANSKAYNRKRAQAWKKDLPNLRSLCLFFFAVFFKGENLFNRFAEDRVYDDYTDTMPPEGIECPTLDAQAIRLRLHPRCQHLGRCVQMHRKSQAAKESCDQSKKPLDSNVTS